LEPSTGRILFASCGANHRTSRIELDVCGWAHAGVGATTACPLSHTGRFPLPIRRKAWELVEAPLQPSTGQTCAGWCTAVKPARLSARSHLPTISGSTRRSDPWDSTQTSPYNFCRKKVSSLPAGGHGVEFSIITNAGNRARERMATRIQADLRAIGIKVNVVMLDFP